jgi:hypothetical protein
VRSAGNYCRGAGKASKLSLLHQWSLPRFAQSTVALFGELSGPRFCQSALLR